MIALTAPTDQLVVQVTSVLSYAAAALPFYCTWNNTGGPVPFARNVGIIPGAPASPIIVIATIPPGVTEIEIREITISNTVAVPAPPPVGAIANLLTANVIIYFHVPSTGIYHQLFQCVLQPGDSLSYNATPGINGTWSIFDARGQKAS